MGCVAYCPEITGIWDGMKNYFLSAGLKFDYVLYSSYEAQVEALIRGHIDIAWNGPLAHVRLQMRTNNTSISLGMRDVDRNCISHVLARSGSGIQSIADLTGRKLAAGSCDSPQAYILPFLHLKESGVPLNTLSVVRYDRDLGKHGDTALGETEVLRALERGDVDAGFVSDLMWSRAVNAGDVNTGPKNHLIVLPNGPPPFDHCQFDSLPSISEAKRAAFTKVRRLRTGVSRAYSALECCGAGRRSSRWTGTCQSSGGSCRRRGSEGGGKGRARRATTPCAGYPTYALKVRCCACASSLVRKHFVGPT